MADYGTDISTLPDLDETFTPISGRRVVAEAIHRRLNTPRGALPFYPTYGLDVRQWLNASLTEAARFSLEANVEAECEKEERVQRASATARFDSASSSLALSIDLELFDGPLRLVLAISKLDVKLFEIE